MKKFLPYMGAAIATLAMTWSVQASAQDMFKDVPSDHWAYSAISDLQAKKILLGYPNGYFQGKRVLTRYEFAVALKRALDAIGTGHDGKDGPQGPAGKDGADGKDGAPGATGAPGMTPEQVEALMKLADTFKAELAQLGTDVKTINAKLDTLSKSVASLTERIDKMVVLGGEFFTGYRGDVSRTAYLDYGGSVRGASKSPFTAVDSPSDFHLTAKANLPGGVKFVGDLVESSYLNYSSLGFGGPTTLGYAGHASANGAPMTTALYQAELIIPVSQIGSGTTLELGRYKNQLSSLIYSRPDTDPYFNLPWYDDGKYVEDGFKLSTKFGSAHAIFFAGSYTNLTTTAGGPLNNVFVGNVNSAGVYVGAPATQSAGINVTLPLFKSGEIGFSVLDFSTAGVSSAGTITNEYVYGGTIKLKPMGKFNISGEVAKSVTQADFTHSDGNNNDDDNAFKVNVGYKSGALGVSAGYLYVDPRFSAPGDWIKIGSRYDVTNIQGPTIGLDYKVNSKLTASAGGGYFEGARNRPGLGFTQGSSIGKITTGLKYNLNKTVHLSADYEGDFYKYSSAVAGVPANAWQQFITLGAGLNLTGNTVLKFGYQILGNQDNLGVAGFTGANQTSNANVFTTSVAVHF